MDDIGELKPDKTVKTSPKLKGTDRNKKRADKEGLLR